MSVGGGKGQRENDFTGLELSQKIVLEYLFYTIPTYSILPHPTPTRVKAKVDILKTVLKQYRTLVCCILHYM